MAHMRSQIRDELKIILAGIPTVNDNLYFDRLPALTEQKIPAVLIYTGGENIERQTLGRPAIQQRTLTVKLAIVVSDTSYDDNSNFQYQIDEILLEIEKRLALNVTLNDLVTSCYIRSTDTDEETETKFEFGILNAYLDVKYRAREDQPDVSNP